jgi:hypothetical protein
MSNVSRYDDVGEQTYNGLKLSFRRRAADGVSLAGNYTVSKCMTDTQWSGSFIQFSSGYADPGNPAYDRGNCSQNQRQIANLTVGYMTPELGNAVLSAFASDWRVSGIVNARTGSWLTVTTGRDPAFSGIPGQRVDQVLDDPYASEKTLAAYLNRAAFANPTPGTLGNEPNRSIEGPGFWTVDMSLARLLPVGNARTLELRVEAFNLLNNFNWGNPGTNFDTGTFGRITSQAGSPRIMQFAVKYGF